MDTSTRPVALITGGSRGIGAATARALAARGYDIVITYRNKAARADAVVAEVEQRGIRGLALASDMTKPADVEWLFARIREWAGRLDVLVLNASGGLERDLVAADPNYPFVLNRDAQVAAVEAAAPLLGPGGTIVFVTSHWAHLYGQVEQMPTYEPVAASKHAGEVALRALQDQLAARGTRLLVVTGDLVEGTITLKLLARAAGDQRKEYEQSPIQLPTTVDMGEAIAAAAADPALPSGHTVVVGRTLEEVRP
jgi:NAD(P)-dependent dehydrogenase (short-subunit alcohol dehydrogenase family)